MHSRKVASVVNDGHLFGANAMIDLGRLNESERRVLGLLAEGHTAKSIANTLGTTPAAVNERLREARRKTGAGSSRELARLLRAQESRHEQIGVAARRQSAALPASSDAESRRPQTGVWAMIALFVIAAAGAAALMTQQPVGNDIDPLIGAPMHRSTDPADLHAKVRTEKRDPVWALRMENAIRARVSQIPLIGKDGNVLRVICGSTLCEIAGTVIDPESKAEQEDQNSQFSRTVKALQVPPLPDDLAKLGLNSESGSFTGGKGTPDRLVFLLYYSRAR
jgi:DNA-binding CsgD family transcriptional regulator